MKRQNTAPSRALEDILGDIRLWRSEPDNIEDVIELEQELLDYCYDDYREWLQFLKQTFPPEETS